MTDRYVGPGGSDVADGLSWANRKLTLNGVEDTPVVAGDTVYVGPGVYRETLTIDVSGSSGNPITYIADITGENTDGVGGIVRISGSNNDDSYPNTRYQCINQVDKDYRTYRGFYFGECTGSDGGVDHYIYMATSSPGSITNNIIEYCYFATSCQSGSGSSYFIIGIRIYQSGTGTVSNNTIRNCVFMSSGGGDITLQEASGNTDWGTIIENNIFYGAWGQSAAQVWINSCYGNTIRGNTFIGDAKTAGMYHNFGIATQNNDIYDNIFIKSTDAMEEAVGNTLNEDYNFLCGSASTLSEGGNSVSSYLPQTAPLLASGYRFPWTHVDVSQYNDNIYMTDNEALTKDVYGLTRPGNGKRTRGAVQFKGVARDESEYRSSPSSIRMDDASQQVFQVPVSDQKKITITMYVKREANYTGTNPQLIVRSPTQSAVTDTDTGSTGVYNKLSVAFTPATGDRWIQVEIRSNNTATSGSYKVWFDDLKILAAKNVIPTMKWVTNEIPLFSFKLNQVLDPWITPTIPIPPTYIPTEGLFHPMPSFFRA